MTYGSGKNEGLFGLKAVNQLGPLSMTTILSREQVRKSSKTKTRDEASSDITIDDFQFVKDVIFSLMNTIKINFIHYQMMESIFIL